MWVDLRGWRGGFAGGFCSGGGGLVVCWILDGGTVVVWWYNGPVTTSRLTGCLCSSGLCFGGLVVWWWGFTGSGFDPVGAGAGVVGGDGA